MNSIALGVFVLYALWEGWPWIMATSGGMPWIIGLGAIFYLGFRHGRRRAR